MELPGPAAIRFPTYRRGIADAGRPGPYPHLCVELWKLVATGLLSAAKATRARREVPWSEVSPLLRGAFEAMKKRGKAELGNKTVLDALDAAATATEGLNDPAAILDAAQKAAAATMDRMRDAPAQIGRARIFSNKSVGLDDPGMVAFYEILEGLR